MADVDRGISVGELADSSGDLARLIGRPVTPWREDAGRRRPALSTERFFGGTGLITCSAIAVMVKLGFTPRLAGKIEPSTT